MKLKLTKIKGFSLIEMLLVLVVISILIWASVSYLQQRAQQMRVDRTSAQMQQILNGGLAYFVANGSWPTSLQCLQGIGPPAACSNAVYLPRNLVSPWGGVNYFVNTNSTGTLFNVYTTISSVSATGSAPAIANVIAGTLPLSYTSTVAPPANPVACPTNATNCIVVGSVNVPGQNLNNAKSVNFAGLYKHGGCVPVPSCPAVGSGPSGTILTPQVMIIPVSVSGVNDPSSPNVYPISSFTGYARGPAATPPRCGNFGTADACNPVNPTLGATYWRACLQVVTEKGEVEVTNTSRWGQQVTLLAITRCSSSTEPSGSPFTVYTR